MRHTLLLLTAMCWLVYGLTSRSAGGTEPVLTRIPRGAVQPQVLVDEQGSAHLVYFKGEPKAGDVFYASRASGAEAFSTAIRINSEPGSAIAAGSIRGAQMALGRDGRVHVAWNGSGKAIGHNGAPMLYARQKDDRSGFETQRDLMTFSGGLDGGGSIAADREGNVYVIWHGNTPATAGKEERRTVFLAASGDHGRTFEAERSIDPDHTGACGCCGLKAFADHSGSLFVLYRAAKAGSERDEVLITSTDKGRSFHRVFAHPWTSMVCPMSSAWLGSGRDAAMEIAWEKSGQVWFARFDPQGAKFPDPVAPLGGGQRKHPVAIGNSQGQTLLVWDEGTGWERGGSLAWQTFDANGKPVGELGRREGIPVWSFAAAAVRQDGQFEIFY